MLQAKKKKGHCENTKMGIGKIRDSILRIITHWSIRPKKAKQL
jgi:threonine aldolase